MFGVITKSNTIIPNVYLFSQVLDDMKQNEFNEDEVDEEYEEFLQLQREFAELRAGLPNKRSDKVIETLVIEVLYDIVTEILYCILTINQNIFIMNDFWRVDICMLDYLTWTAC